MRGLADDREAGAGVRPFHPGSISDINAACDIKVTSRRPAIANQALQGIHLDLTVDLTSNLLLPAASSARLNRGAPTTPQWACELQPAKSGEISSTEK